MDIEKNLTGTNNPEPLLFIRERKRAERSSRPRAGSKTRNLTRRIRS
jgi:hypothetical protein